MRFYKELTLRKRIVFLFSLAAFIPFICTVLLSYKTIYSISESKLEDKVLSNLRQVELTLSYVLDSLDQVSQQFVYPSSLALQLNDYLQTDDVNQKMVLKERISTELGYISYTNANMGLTVYLSENESTYFQNMFIKDSFSFDELPLLTERRGDAFYGPHLSSNRLDNQYVISLVRNVGLPNNDSVYLYLETSVGLTKSLLDINSTDNNTFYLVLNETSDIIFSELNFIFPVSSTFESAIDGEKSGLVDEYYWFQKQSDLGWSVVSLIPKSGYDKERNQWIMQMVLLAIIFGFFSLFIGWLLWKMVYKPIHHFDKEISLITKNELDVKPLPTHIPEFDELLEHLQKMKKQIAILIHEVEKKEKKRADLEIEKLMYQINPHFLMNSLDTVRWIAVLNKQDEINEIVSSLNKLLYYNLKRRGKISTVEEELDSLRQYCNLQEKRYQFTYNVRIRVPYKLLKTPIPMFILQPLVENSIYHGLGDEGRIEVVVIQVDNDLRITVCDNGAGLTVEERANILTDGNDEEGLGIGLNYVKRMLKNHYQNKASLNIESRKGEGTKVMLTLPINQ
ncbi:sensor histidine kinase [Halalkalibacter sp. AB-rgal2]|uniref:sensor histidine kinase n=1 Tax=Halalkalibacter sp. AB-rgal2 TaxID=3242695 RepID=UPI00359DD040